MGRRPVGPYTVALPAGLLLVPASAGVILGSLAGLLGSALAGAVGGLLAGVGAEAALAARVVGLAEGLPQLGQVR